eukprot:2957626-Pyramimonas_sp.AAC.1
MAAFCSDKRSSLKPGVCNAISMASKVHAIDAKPFCKFGTPPRSRAGWARDPAASPCLERAGAIAQLVTSFWMHDRAPCGTT